MKQKITQSLDSKQYLGERLFQPTWSRSHSLWSTGGWWRSFQPALSSRNWSHTGGWCQVSSLWGRKLGSGHTLLAVREQKQRETLSEKNKSGSSNVTRQPTESSANSLAAESCRSQSQPVGIGFHSVTRKREGRTQPLKPADDYVLHNSISQVRRADKGPGVPSIMRWSATMASWLLSLKVSQQVWGCHSIAPLPSQHLWGRRLVRTILGILGPGYYLGPKRRGTLKVQSSLLVDNQVITTAVFQMILPSNKEMPGTIRTI